MKIKALFILLILALPCMSWSCEVGKATAISDINLRASPPSSLLGQLGKMLDIVKKGEELKVTKVIRHKGWTGTFIWCEVTRVNPPKGKPSKGFIYYSDSKTASKTLKQGG